MFIDFLTTAPPFKDLFNKDSANDFYEGVRCGLLHEARTKNGWKIKVARGEGPFAELASKIIFRDRLQTALLTYIAWYGQALPKDRELQNAFIRKFDDLCRD